MRRSKGYIRTELSCESKTNRRYRGFDFWISHREFEQFREQYAVHCERLKQWVADEGLLDRELLLGSFYVDESDEGTDLALA